MGMDSSRPFSKRTARMANEVLSLAADRPGNHVVIQQPQSWYDLSPGLIAWGCCLERSAGVEFPTSGCRNGVVAGAPLDLRQPFSTEIQRSLTNANNSHPGAYRYGNHHRRRF